MTLWDAVSLSLISVSRRKMASGTSAVILAIALVSFTQIAGFVKSISEEIDRISSGLFANTLVLVIRDSVRDEVAPLEASLRSIIAESNDAIVAVNGWTVTRSTASAGGVDIDVTLYGVEGDPAIESGSSFLYGTGLSNSATAGYDRICILGANVAAALEIDTTLERGVVEVNINGVSCEVHGVLRLSDNIYSSRFDRAIIVPLRSSALYFQSMTEESYGEHVDSFTIILDESSDIAQVRMDIDRSIRRYYGVPQNQISPIEFLDGATPRRLAIRQRSLLQDLFIFTGTIAFISGIIGYVASLYYFFVRRVREFAIRQAVGASPVDIFIQAISEAIIIGLVGGLSGAVFGLLAARIASATTDWGITADLTLLALSCGVGIASGIALGVPTVLVALRGAPAAAAKVLS